jgi:hypothetical protein
MAQHNVNKRKFEEVTDSEANISRTSFLSAPVPSKNHASQLVSLNNHLEYLEIAVQKNYGEISQTVTQNILPDIIIPEREPGVSKSVYKKMLNIAIDDIQERKRNLPKALGFILSTIDISFSYYIKKTPETKIAYQDNRIEIIMKHLNIWYNQKLGSTSADMLLTDCDEIEDAENNWKKFHQLKDQSVEDFFKLFQSNMYVFISKTGNELSEKKKAFKFVTKLNKNRYGEWVKKMGQEQKIFAIKKKSNSLKGKYLITGYPTSLDEAYQLAIIEEIRTSKDFTENGQDLDSEEDEQIEKEDETPPVHEMQSYAGVKSKKGKENPSNNGNQNKKRWPPGTKPSTIGYALCNNPAHKPGEDRDHLHWECPHPKPQSKNKNIPSQSNPSSLPDNFDYKKLAELLAPMILKEAMESREKERASYYNERSY